MPQRRKNPKPRRSVNRSYKKILPKLSNIVENPAGYGAPPGGSQPPENSGNANNSNANPLQPVAPTPPSQAPPIYPVLQSSRPGSERSQGYAFLAHPGGRRIYAVDVKAAGDYQPLCAVFNSRAATSVMVASCAERLPGVTLFPTTPAQRQRWYFTPAGPLHSPQRYAQFALKAFDPAIPMVSLKVLIWEGDGPIDGVHVYLGRPVFVQVEEHGIELRVQETVDFAGFIGPSPMNRCMGLDGSAGMPDPPLAPYDGGAGPSSRSHLGPTSFITNLGPSPFYNSDFSETTPTPSLFSKAWCTSTAPSLPSAVGLSTRGAEFLEKPEADDFSGRHDDNPGDGCIDPTMLSNLSGDMYDVGSASLDDGNADSDWTHRDAAINRDPDFDEMLDDCLSISPREDNL